MIPKDTPKTEKKPATADAVTGYIYFPGIPGIISLR